MKKIITLTFLATLCLTSMAQNNVSKRLTREEFREKQISFITEKAELSAEEAGMFFPLYFELQDKKAKLGRTPWKKIRKQTTDPTDEECDKMLTQFYNSRIEASQLDKDYYEKFKKILTPKKIMKIQRAEMKFRRQMMHGRCH